MAQVRHLRRCQGRSRCFDSRDAQRLHLRAELPLSEAFARGTVLEEQLEGDAHTKAAPCPRVDGLHVVAYNLRMIEGFVNRISRESAERQAMVASTYLDERLRERAHALMRRRNEALEDNHEVAPLMAAPPASNSGHATSLSSDAEPASAS